MVRILLLIASGIITIIFWTPLVVYGEVVHHSTLYTALGISGTIIFETTILFLLFIRDVHFIPPDKN